MPSPELPGSLPLPPAEQLPKPPLVVLVGPTAVGKTEIAIELAEKLQGEIVSADSRLFYRRMNIGTAKPSPDERRRVPHHLIDVADPDQLWSLAQFQLAARGAIASIHTRGHLPFLVGGTGQYIRAVYAGWEPPRVAPVPRLRQALESWAAEIGPQELHHRLTTLDPAAAQQIDFRNLRRTIRALEVIFTTGERFSAQRNTAPAPYSLLQIGLHRPRAELYARIDARIEKMLRDGFLEEVRELLRRGYSPELPTLTAIGYRELVAHLADKLSLEEATAQIKRQTRVFVRRQANWFKLDDPNIHWFRVQEDTTDVIEEIIRQWLAQMP